jgi:hypothetical protein
MRFWSGTRVIERAFCKEPLSQTEQNRTKREGAKKQPLCTNSLQQPKPNGVRFSCCSPRAGKAETPVHQSLVPFLFSHRRSGSSAPTPPTTSLLTDI